MFFELLLSAPIIGLVWIVVIILALTVHEFAHAYVAYKHGDKTAEHAGRLTLNPLPHISLSGFIFMLIFGFGWAKPVPFNPYNLKNPKRDAVWIALAGPGSNLIMAAAAAIILRIVLTTGIAAGSLLPLFLILTVIINLFLLFFNIVPVPPLDGSKLIDALLQKPQHAQLRIAIHTYGPQILFAMVFIAILTSIDVFFFVSGPSYFVCDLLVGDSCNVLLSTVF